MSRKAEYVPLEEAIEQVRVAVSRLALLHLSFSKILVDELGEEKGKDLIIKSVAEYGRRVGERTKQGLQDLPKYGVTEKNEDGRAYNCVLGRIFQEYGEEELGCLYCYVDAAKSMAVDPNRKLIHKTSIACGDEHCTFEWANTTEKEREDFKNNATDWKLVDPRLVKGSGLD
jgi:hypothetical protein